LSVTTENVGPLKPKELEVPVIKAVTNVSTPFSSSGRPIRSGIKRKYGAYNVESTPEVKVIKVVDRSTEPVEESTERELGEVEEPIEQSACDGKNLDGTDLPSDNEDGKATVKVEVYNEYEDVNTDLEELDDGDNDDDYAAEEFDESSEMLDQEDFNDEDYIEEGEYDESLAEEAKELMTPKTRSRIRLVS